MPCFVVISCLDENPPEFVFPTLSSAAELAP